MSKKKLTPGQFERLGATLAAELTKALEAEIQDCALPELVADSSTDLWSPPKVDSKTVVKLSPKVKELTGWSLEPAWIQKGGYPTVQQAVSHIVAQIKKNCVAEPTTVRAAESQTTVAPHA